jgi:hypothetical protein
VNNLIMVMRFTELLSVCVASIHESAVHRINLRRQIKTEQSDFYVTEGECTGVEPSARSSGSFSMRSLATHSTG